MTVSVYEERLRRVGLSVPEVLIPAPHVDLPRWVVAPCDQHVHDDSYWRRARARIGDRPSALSTMLPESDLDRVDLDAAVASIHAAMERHAAGNLRVAGTGLVVARRRDPGRVDRVGVLLSFDLECEHDGRSAFLLRPTESVVEERMPAREAIRCGAILEVPHLLVLADDASGALQRALDACRGEPLYDAPLPECGARIQALLASPEGAESVVAALESAARPRDDRSPFRWFAGDGNHSLETARRHWSRLRGALSPGERLNHPARFAMGELVPFASPALEILPVLRHPREVPASDLLRAFSDAGFVPAACAPESLRADASSCGMVAHGRAWRLDAPGDVLDRIAAVDAVLDRAMRRNPSAGIDYLHGWGEVSAAEGVCLVVVPAFARDELRGILQQGRLCPRKSFSLGGPAHKRHCLEARFLRRPAFRTR